MKYFEFVPEGIEDCRVEAYLQTYGESSEMQERKIPAVVICPGGGYGFTSDREGEPVAKDYFAAGYHVFVLWYAVGEKATNFYPLCQLAATVAHVRKHAAEWSLDPNRVAVGGFSAGGHLACSLGTLYNEPEFLKVWNRDDAIRPDAMILSYPVITADEYAHVGSIENVSGCAAGTEGYKWFGLDKHVDETTPVSFLWHTAPDDCVPVENSLKFVTALSANKVSFEMHIFPEGGHGMSVCTKETGSDNPYNARWMEWSIKWLNKMFSFEK